MTKQRRNEYLAQWREKNRLKIRQQSSAWYERHGKDNELVNKRKVWWKSWYVRNRVKKLEQSKAWREANIEKTREIKRLWRLKNRSKILKIRTGELDKYPRLKIATYLRGRLNCALRGKNARKRSGLTDLLGISIDELRVYLEALFKDGMNWENYGKWHIDHIIPISSFDLSTLNGQKEAMNYKNLQPLWALDNMRKGKKQ